MTFSSALGTMLLLLQVSHTPPVLRPDTVGTFSAPYNALEGGWVVADLSVSSAGQGGGVGVLFAQPPFAASVVGPAAQWTFQPATDAGAPAPARVGVIAYFRQGALHTPAGPFQGIDPATLDLENRPALPVAVTAPGYPANSIAEGAVMLELKVDESGRAGEVNVIRGVDSLTEPAIGAVRSWTFAPARRNGVEVPGLAIAIIHFQRPVVVDPS